MNGTSRDSFGSRDHRRRALARANIAMARHRRAPYESMSTTRRPEPCHADADIGVLPRFLMPQNTGAPLGQPRCNDQRRNSCGARADSSGRGGGGASRTAGLGCGVWAVACGVLGQ